MTDSDATQGDNMSPAEFAKLMGAYPQPAENPLPAYGGYMDNSAANFSWVQNNDYFGAETFEATTGYGYDDPSERMTDEEAWLEMYDDYLEAMTPLYMETGQDGDAPMTLEEYKKWVIEAREEDYQMQVKFDQRLKDEGRDMDGNPIGTEYGFDEYGNLAAENDEMNIYQMADIHEKQARFLRPLVEKAIRNGCFDKETSQKIMDDGRPLGLQLVESDYFRDAEDFDNKSNPIKKYCLGCGTPRKLEKLPYQVGIDGTQAYACGDCYEDVREAETFNGLSAEEYYAEMEELTDGVASITNRFGDGVGIIQVDDEDLEDVSVEITDGDGDVVYEGILGDEDVPEMEDDDFYLSENKKKSSILPMALGVIGAIFAYQPVMEFLSSKSKKEEKMAETPELVENPNTGNLDPAQYEEMVVESTGYAVDVIPQVLDGSFMGSRFAALPTERYVDYNEPGIGAHTDIALDRNEMYLEPEMAMVQASESVKESQAPGQSPYNSVDGEENRDFDMRVLKETQVISLDPAAVPFIPQSMSGYTGNANTPPSVYDKMFNIGVLGQTPAFVPGSGDIGSSHTGSRNAIPNSLGIAGSVGGPLSDQVNANYTDGTTSMSLAQWAIENTVNQSSDTEAVVIDRSSGAMKRVRRV